MTFLGDPNLYKTLISCKTLFREVQQEKRVFGPFKPHRRDSRGTSIDSINGPAVVMEFKDVFKMLHELPPRCSHEHNIMLQTGTNPVSVRPYRYPHAQKDEIEKLVHKMLEEIMIQPSMSPFFSTILLVKKKDGSWHFCIDYRAFNQVIVLDKFLVLVIDELLQELHGSTIFTKLDLKMGYHQIQMKLGMCQTQHSGPTKVTTSF